MYSSRPQCRDRLYGVAGFLALALSLLALGPGAPIAQAALKPEIAAVWSSEVVATSARLRAEINPEGSQTGYHFDYITQAAYEANLAAGREGFAGAVRAPAGGDVSIGEGTVRVSVLRSISGLSPETAYRYRVQATNGGGTEPSAAYALRTQGLGSGQLLADGRGWEMVSPIEKNGGEVQATGEIGGGGVLQVSSDGEDATYSSFASFGAGAVGAPAASQYISRRTPGGWLAENITTPTVSGSYGEHPNGVPYQLFSGDLTRGIVLNGEHCREAESMSCPVANPPLAGSEAPPGYQDYYLRNDETGAFSALVRQANSPSLTGSPDWFDLALAGASPDLRHVILSTCAKLTAAASEVPGPEGCDPTKPNLYEYAEGGQLRLVNTGPGAELAAQGGAVSGDGQRVYFTEAGKLWLREGVSTPYELAEGGEFQTAVANGAIALYTNVGHLYRYDAGAHSSTDLTPSGGVEGVLGASEDGSIVYFQDAAGLEQWREGATIQIAPGAQAAEESDWPPTTGTARVSADGNRLLFLSKARLSGYDNTPAEPADCGGEVAGVFQSEPCQEVFLYDAGSHGLACLSCNPTGERPEGPSTIPGAIANGKEAAAPGEIVTDAYKPRALSMNGRRLFIDSRDALLLQDTDKAPDVYEWEAQGEGSCQGAGGCLSLVSDGRSVGGAVFVDASADGSDAFLLTEGSLVPADPGSADLYDAREGGGFPEPPSAIPCQADACQSLPAEPEDPEPGTLRQGPGNPPSPPPLLSPPSPSKCAKGRVLKAGRCVSKPATRCAKGRVLKKGRCVGKPRHKKTRPLKRSGQRAARSHRSAR